MLPAARDTDSNVVPFRIDSLWRLYAASGVQRVHSIVTYGGETWGAFSPLPRRIIEHEHNFMRYRRSCREWSSWVKMVIKMYDRDRTVDFVKRTKDGENNHVITAEAGGEVER